jgi:hypothetical protein
MRNSTLPPRRSYIKRGKPPARRTAPKALSDKPVPKLKTALDALCSKYVRLRDNFTCVICGTRNPIWSKGDPTSAECGHLLSRTVSALRFDLRPAGNLHCNCHRCNVRHGGQHFRFKSTIDQWPYVKWYIVQYGADAWEALRAEGAKGKQWRAWELEQLIEETKIALEQLKAAKGTDET